MTKVSWHVILLEVGKIWEREIGVAPEDIGDDSNSNEDKSGAIEFPGETNEENNENTESQDSEISESISEISATESEISATESEVSSTNISTSKSEVSSSKTQISSSKSEVSSSKKPVSSSKEEPISSSKEEPISSSKEEPISSSKEEPAKPSGKQVVQGGTVETSYGVKIPVVSEFNKIGLVEGNDWTGEGTVGNDFDKAYGKALQEYSEKANYGIHDSPILPAGDDTIHNGTAYDEIGPVTLRRNTSKGCYYFYYTMDISDLNDDAIKRQRDLSLFMLSMITSTPTEVEKAIYESQFTAPSGKEPIKGEWTKVGDCEIKYTRGQPDPYFYEYAIRPCK